MTKEEEIYDWLLTMKIQEPAVLMLGTRCVVGRWETLSEELPNGHICRSGKLGIHVLGEGESWEVACEAARMKLA